MCIGREVGTSPPLENNNSGLNVSLKLTALKPSLIFNFIP
jgi:hypothetical protein